MRESVPTHVKNLLLQWLAMLAPAAGGTRVTLHRLRGVTIGRDVWIGSGVMIETGHPSLVTIGDRVTIGIRTTILAHFLELTGVRIENDVYIGACAVILPGVTIGEGSVVSGGSVVTASVPPMTVVQGNPAKSIAKCGVPLGKGISRAEFMRKLKPLHSK